MKPTSKKPTIIFLISQLVIWFAFSGLCLYAGLSATRTLLYGVIEHPDIIVFSKIGFTLLGVGIPLLIITFSIAIIIIRLHEIPKKWVRLFRHLTFLGIFIALIGVHIVQYTMNTYTESIGYEYCTGRTQHQLLILNITYAKPGKCIKDE